MIRTGFLDQGIGTKGSLSILDAAVMQIVVSDLRFGEDHAEVAQQNVISCHFCLAIKIEFSNKRLT